MGIAVQLAEQSIAVFLGPIGEMRYKAFDLLARGFAEGFGATEIDSVRLDQVGIELMLTDQLAQAVADSGPALVSVLAIDRLGWELLRLPGSNFGRARALMMPPWNEATELRTPNCTFRQVSSPKQHRAAATGRPFGF